MSKVIKAIERDDWIVLPNPKGIDGQPGKSAYEIAVEQGYEGTEEQWLESLKGIQGEIGETGPRGEQGVQGEQGPKGDKGNDGYTPIKGVDYFDGEQGPKGDKGDTGDTGAPGSDASVTNANVISALGYSPISPTQLSDKVKTDVPINAKFTDTVYSHPTSHPASIITESSTKRFVSDTKISEWDGKETTTGSQDKANQAEQNAKDYTDQEISSIDIPDSTWESIQNKPDTFAPSEHNHTIGNITGLQNELNSKETPSASQSKANVAESNAKSYVDSKVQTDVPSGAKFTDTITTINGKTGTILKADIVALGVPAQDTVYTHPAGTNPHGTTKSDVGLSNVTNDKQMPISGGVLENYREKLATLSGTSTTINLSLGNVFAHALSGNTTYSITNAVNGQAHSFTLIIHMGSTVRTVTFPSSVKWQGGEIPDMSTASKTYVLTFVTINGGTTWLGMLGGEF